MIPDQNQKKKSKGKGGESPKPEEYLKGKMRLVERKKEILLDGEKKYSPEWNMSRILHCLHRRERGEQSRHLQRKKGKKTKTSAFCKRGQRVYVHAVRESREGTGKENGEVRLKIGSLLQGKKIHDWSSDRREKRGPSRARRQSERKKETAHL